MLLLTLGVQSSFAGQNGHAPTLFNNMALPHKMNIVMNTEAGQNQ
jgi:hypothetical protein